MIFTTLLLGTGASRKIGLGFTPVRVILRNLVSGAFIEWADSMQASANASDGVLTSTSSGSLVFTLLASGQGIRLYDEGEVVSASSAAAVMPASQVDGYCGDLRGNVTKWTLQNSGNRTGKFDAAVDTSKIGAGSPVQIGGKLYYIQTLTNAGNGDNEVKLNLAAATGPVEFLGYRFGLAPVPVGGRIPRGIIVAETTVVNKSGELLHLTAFSE